MTTYRSCIINEWDLPPDLTLQVGIDGNCVVLYGVAEDGVIYILDEWWGGKEEGREG